MVDIDWEHLDWYVPDETGEVVAALRAENERLREIITQLHKHCLELRLGENGQVLSVCSVCWAEAPRGEKIINHDPDCYVGKARTALEGDE